MAQPPQPTHGDLKHIFASSGTPLEASTRTHFEQRLGVDFSRVRVHTGEGANAATSLLQTPAFAVGRNIVFGAGQYAPKTTTGYETLSHELVHVAQQRGARDEAPSGTTERDGFAEREAEAIATTLSRGGRATPTVIAGPPQIACRRPPPRVPRTPPRVIEESPALRDLPREEPPSRPIRMGRRQPPPTWAKEPQELWEWQDAFRNPPRGSPAYQSRLEEAVRVAEIPQPSMDRQGTAPDFVWKDGRQNFADPTFTSFSADVNRFSVPNAIEHDASRTTTERGLSNIIGDYFPDLFPDWSPPDFGLNGLTGTTLGAMRAKHFGFRYRPKTIDPDGFGRLSALQRGVQKAVKAQPELQLLPMFKLTLGDVKPKAKAKPKVDPLPENKARENEKTALETAPSGDPEKPGKPLMWRTPVNYKETTSTGGLAGGLDFRFPKEKTFSVSIKVPDIDTYTLSVDKNKSMPWHAHHTWPKFVGGAPSQPLMSVRDMVHISVIHPALYAYLGFLGHPISNTETANKKFIKKLKDNADFRKDLKRQMTYFYIRVNELTDPKMPSSAYEKGIDHSMEKLAAP